MAMGFNKYSFNRAVTRGFALVIAAVLFIQIAPTRAHAYWGDKVMFEGRGWGHGRGMGQFGALGYAVERGWPHNQILTHFYGGTAAGSIANDLIRVRLMRMDNKVTVVQQENGGILTAASPGSFHALKATLIGANQFRVEQAPNCSGPWSVLNGSVTGPVWFAPQFRDDNRTNMLQLCEPDGSFRWLRGDIHALDSGDGQRTINQLPIESYLYGVVPRESPASWADLGGGNGINALRAQAVAARSYAASENRYGYAKTCDTTSCQVYAGRALQDGLGFRDLEDPRTNRAVDETSGQVRIRNGVPARTEFSSSTGGWTAGGTFPSVQDEGDSISLNPNSTWRFDVSVASIQSAWPSIGDLVAFTVTRRNGIGEWAGRVLEVKIEGTRGSVLVSGDEVRSKLGLRSNWFNILAPGGYWMIASDGGIFAFGNAGFHGSTGGWRLKAPIVGMAPTNSGNGYWLVAADGGIFAFGDAGFHGSTGAMTLKAPIVGMAPTDSGNGYWLVASDGGIFAFGDAGFHGSTGAMTLKEPIVGMAPTDSGNGYWLVASDGGIFAFGEAGFHGSTGAMTLKEPIVGMAPTASGNGYWLVASDGGIFAFGDAGFHGSTGGMRLAKPVVAMATTDSGGGYWLVAADGGVFSFGDASFYGSMGGKPLVKPIVGTAATRSN